MTEFLGKSYGSFSLFDPEEGMLVRAPLGDGPGWWTGAPSATFDPISNQFFLVYRLRQPRELGRGVECRIASSENGVTFTDIWALPKSTLGALSIERASLLRLPSGRWYLYVGYVSPIDRRWRIGLLEADEPDQFDISTLTPLLTAEDLGCDGVKDPNVIQIGPMYYLLVSYAVGESDFAPEVQQAKHAQGDVFNTGLIRSRTGAAVSGDGRHFQWIGDISPISNRVLGQASDTHATPAWDEYCRRIGALLPLGTGGYVGFYDGSATVEENYEERTGLAITFDLKTYYSLSLSTPALISPYASGSLRYIDVLAVGHELFYYYEMARPDGAHELRVSVVERV